MSKKFAASFNFDEISNEMQSLLEQAKIPVSSEQIQQLTTIVEMLNHWNAALNLTAIKDPRQMVLLHIVDSAVLVPVLNEVVEAHAVKQVADVGTGAGFPGLVLAIMRPDLHFTLIDSVGKKLSFVRQVVAKLQLKNVELINKRCEEITDHSFDCIVSRAFAPLERMVSWCLPLLSSDGRFIAMKANLEQQEIADVPESVTIENNVPLHVPTLDAVRCAVILKRSTV